MLDAVQLRPAYPVVTHRLRLRPLSLSDVEALHDYRSLEEVCRFIPGAPMDHETILEKPRGAWSQTAVVSEGDALIHALTLTTSDCTG
jgi:RimJ/RimL family protein N-acetyltransferase